MMTIEPDGNATEEHPSHDRSALRYSNPTTDPEIPTERLTPSGTFSYRRGTPRTPSCGVKSSVPCRTRRLSCRVESNRTKRQLDCRKTSRDDDARLTKGESTSDHPVGHGLGEEHVCELGEWGFEDEEQGRGHDQSKPARSRARARE